MEFWQEPEDTSRHAPDDSVVDLAFRLVCRTLPLDHAYELSKAICAELAWIDRESRAGIHLIHGAESGNGWQRPENSAQDVLQLSKRTRLTLRLPKERITDAETLVGKQLNVGEHILTVGEVTVKTLNDHSTLFSRYVVTYQKEDEPRFNTRIANELNQMGIQVRKLLCGRTLTFATPDKPVFVKSVLLADLEAGESIRMQQTGLGPHRTMGCGLFVPHKGIAAIHEQTSTKY